MQLHQNSLIASGGGGWGGGCFFFWSYLLEATKFGIFVRFRFGPHLLIPGFFGWQLTMKHHILIGYRKRIWRLVDSVFLGVWVLVGLNFLFFLTFLQFSVPPVVIWSWSSLGGLDSILSLNFRSSLLICFLLGAEFGGFLVGFFDSSIAVWQSPRWDFWEYRCSQTVSLDLIVALQVSLS